MARAQKITAGQINIRLHPHPPGIYGEFIEALYALRRPIGVYGDRLAVLSLLNRVEANDGIYTGFITLFTKINKDIPWFDASTFEEADDDRVSQISIPDDLYPNAVAFPFLFDTARHRFFTQTYSKGKTVAINQIERLLIRLSEDLIIFRDFGEAKIDVVKSRIGLDRVFSLPVIKKLTFVISKPNADILDDDFEENVEGFLANLESKRLTLIIEAEAGKSIRPNPEVRRIGQATLELGSAKAEGRDAHGAVTISTTDYPKSLHDKYDPSQTTENLAFRRLTGH